MQLVREIELNAIALRDRYPEGFSIELDDSHPGIDLAMERMLLPDIATLRPLLVPEIAVWAARDSYLIAGRADALAISGGKVEVAIDWKSDVNPTESVRAAYAEQLRDYLEATGAPRGALVFLTLGEVVWVEASNRSSIS